MKKAVIVTALVAISMGLCGTAWADKGRYGWWHYAWESVEVSDHTTFGTGEKVNGATILYRDLRNRTVTGNLSSNALMPNGAYSIWLAIFNRPRKCAMPFACATSDIGNPAVRASVIYGGGFVSDADGTGSATFSLVPGRTGREVFAGSDDGLLSMMAEIHVVLRSHGEAGVAGPVAKQIGTANEACPDDECANVFFSIHPPRD